MTEERLKEIKDSIDFQREYYNAIQKEDFLFDEELELYNEVVRLRKLLNPKTIQYSMDDQVDY